jgi:hypothetical protein
MSVRASWSARPSLSTRDAFQGFAFLERVVRFRIETGVLRLNLLDSGVSLHFRWKPRMTDDEFLLAFEQCAFTRPEWTHEAHVRMAWLYLSRRPFTDALDRIRRGIRRLNDRIGQPPATHRAPDRLRCRAARSPSGDPNGYHETITVSLSRIIASRLVAGEDYPGFRNSNPDLFDRKLPVLFRHYSAALLWSPEARRQFEEADIQELPAVNCAALA